METFCRFLISTCCPLPGGAGWCVQDEKAEQDLAFLRFGERTEVGHHSPLGPWGRGGSPHGMVVETRCDCIYACLAAPELQSVVPLVNGSHHSPFLSFCLPGSPEAPEAKGEDGTSSISQVENPRDRQRKIHSQRLAEFRLGGKIYNSWTGRQREQGKNGGFMYLRCPETSSGLRMPWSQPALLP